MVRQRHYQNRVPPGGTAFVTTTTLDFAPIFLRPAVANLAVQLLFEAHRHLGAVLHAYVVMPEHVHFVSGLPANKDVAQFMRLLKAHMARELRAILNPTELAMFSEQIGLNQRTLWQRSFRSFTVDDPDVFHQKVQYTHANPCRRRICARPEDYEWSSARAWLEVRWRPDIGVMDAGQ